MRHRLTAFLLTLVLALLAVPLPAEAQRAGKVYRIGAFHVGLDHVPPSQPALRQGLKELGYEEGKNLHLDWRNLPNEEVAREVAKEFARDRVDLIVAFENHTVRAAKAATSTIPIVMLHVTDPVSDGFVKSLARPGGNVTGFAGLADLPAKRLELFKGFVPALARVLLLVDPQDPVTPRALAEVQRTASVLKLKFVDREATTKGDIQRIFSSVNAGDVDGVFVVSPSLYLRFTLLITRLALEKRLPVPWHDRAGAEAGALFSYGGDLAAVGREAATYVDKILEGTNPRGLPVQQLARFELIVNLKTAKTLGLTIPPSVLMRADRVIE